MLQKSDLIEYKLPGMTGIVVVYIQISRTSVNVDLIGIKLYST